MAWYDERVAALSAEGFELSESDINIMKKYQNAIQFDKASFHAFRRASGAITLPTGDDNEVRQQTTEILRKLGADKEKYDFKIPDGFPEDVRPSDERIQAFKDACHERCLLPHQANAQFKDALEDIKAGYDEQQTKEQEALAKRNESLEKLKKDLTEKYDDKYDEHIQSVRRAMEKYEYGEGLFDDKKQPTDKFFELGDNLKPWEKIAGDLGESGFKPSESGNAPKTEVDYSKKYPNSGYNADGTLPQ